MTRIRGRASSCIYICRPWRNASSQNASSVQKKPTTFDEGSTRPSHPLSLSLCPCTATQYRNASGALRQTYERSNLLNIGTYIYISTYVYKHINNTIISICFFLMLFSVLGRSGAILCRGAGQRAAREGEKVSLTLRRMRLDFFDAKRHMREEAHKRQAPLHSAR
jgi:hypothetical protein